MQERFIKIQLTPISKCYLKFNFKFLNKVISAVRSKLLQINNLKFLLSDQTFTYCGALLNIKSQSTFHSCCVRM